LLHHKAPHRTWQPDTSYLDKLEDVEYDLPVNFFDNYEGRSAAASQRMSVRTSDMDLLYDLKIDDGKGGIQSRFGKYDHTSRMNEDQKVRWNNHYRPLAESFLANPLTGKDLEIWKFQRYMRDYLACVKSVDENTGRLLKYLEDSGLLDNTIIIYTSDQGFYLGEHGWFDKRFMYEESMRTPLIIRPAAGKDVPEQIPDLVQNIDIAPTILDMAGVQIPGRMQGLSLLGLMNDKNKKDWRTALYYHYYEFPNEHMVKKHYGIRTERYKLIHFYDDIDSWELYDLDKDPGEMNNLIDNREYETIKKELLVRLDEIMFEYGDTISETFQSNFELTSENK
jgi:arylsulfatase A-like enzyme